MVPNPSPDSDFAIFEGPGGVDDEFVSFITFEIGILLPELAFDEEVDNGADGPGGSVALERAADMDTDGGRMNFFDARDFGFFAGALCSRS